MELAVAKALKPSLRREFIFQQALSEEILCLNGNSVIGGEDFSVDDLLDLSNGESLHCEQQQEEEEYDEEEKDSFSLSSHSQDSNSNSTDVSYDSIFSTELVVPAGDLEDLEWVSHFVDDSLPDLSLLYPLQTNTVAEPESRACLPKKTPRFPSEMKITTKARTTKTRKPNPRVWSLSPLLSCPSSPSTCSSAVSGEPPAKKQKRKAEAPAVGSQAQDQAHLQRRCSHCHVQKTPQWRTGPLGAKTLCNACGVRYKSGRLFSEYRPACSPTFRSEIHSNSHRRVLEIRRRKGMVGPEPGLAAQTQMVPTC